MSWKLRAILLVVVATAAGLGWRYLSDQTGPSHQHQGPFLQRLGAPVAVEQPGRDRQPKTDQEQNQDTEQDNSRSTHFASSSLHQQVDELEPA